MALVDDSSMMGHGSTTKLVLMDGSQLLVPEQVVAEGPGKMYNPLTEHQVFSKLQRNKFFEIQPSVVYFGGFMLDHVHEQVVHVVNTSAVTKRLHIIQCDTKNFRVVVNKKGKVAPGMSEELLIQFIPNEWRYFYDTVRIHTDDDNLLIPLHAYPTVAPRHGPKMTARIMQQQQPEFFPTKVDMGRKCKISQTVMKEVPIVCNVPIDFEFSVRVLQPHPDIALDSLEGSVPGAGRAVITFLYTPSRLATAEMIVEVSISQFGFKPVVCSVIGSAGPGDLRSDKINTITKDLQRTGVVGAGFNLENYSKISSRQVMADLNIVHDLAKGFKDSIGKMRASQTSGEPIKISKVMPREPEPDTFEDGYQIPANLRPRAATQFVLNQVKGKLSWIELKRQMEESGQLPASEGEGMDPKAKANQSIKWYEMQRMQPGSFLDVEEDYGEGQTRQICEYRYEFELRMRDDYDKAKEVKWFPAIGDDPPSVEEVCSVQERRAEREVEATARWRDTQRNMRANVCDPEKSVAHLLGGLPKHEPSFDPYMNDAWSTRKEVTERFRQEVHKLIIRERVVRRIAAINGKLDLVGVGGANVQIVDAILSAEGSAPVPTGGAEKPKLHNLDHDRVVTHTFPLYRDGNFRDRLPVLTGEINVFEDWDYVDLKVLPAIRTYVPLESLRGMRDGAEEEAGVRSSRGRASVMENVEMYKIPECFTAAAAGKPSLCRAMDLRNRPTEGRDRSIIYKDIIVHESHREWALRPFERKVGDTAFKCEEALLLDTRGLRLEDSLFGQVKEANLVYEPEAPGLNSMRVLGSTPMLRELHEVLVALLPRMMDGPDPDDEQSEDEGEDMLTESYGAAEDKEGKGANMEIPIVISPPTLGYVQENFKLPSRMYRRLGDQGPEDEAADGGENKGAEEDADNPLAEPIDERPVPLNSRAMHERKMEEEFATRRRALEERVPGVLAGLNGKIHDPRKKLALEPSIFPSLELGWLTKREPTG